MLDLDNILLEDLEHIYHRNINWKKFRNATVLITGANGLIASYMIYMLLYLNVKANLNVKIIGLARNPQKVAAKYGQLLERTDFKMIYQDVTEPLKTMDPIDYIIHTASPTGPKQFTKTPVDTILANVMGTYHLLEAGRQKGAKGFLLLSTREIYGSGTKDFVSEEDYGALDPTVPRSCYPESKRMSETLCAAYNAQYGFNCKVVRIAHTYGPGMLLRDGRVVGDFIGNVVDGKDIIMNSDGSGTLALTYIADVIAGIMQTICNFSGFVYNISNSSETTSVKKLAETLCGLFSEKNLTPRFHAMPPEEKAGYLTNKLGFLDSQKALAEGWEIKVPLVEGMRRTLLYFENRRKEEGHAEILE